MKAKMFNMLFEWLSSNKLAGMYSNDEPSGNDFVLEDFRKIAVHIAGLLFAK